MKTCGGEGQDRPGRATPPLGGPERGPGGRMVGKLSSNAHSKNPLKEFINIQLMRVIKRNYVQLIAKYLCGALMLHNSMVVSRVAFRFQPHNKKHKEHMKQI